jgi:hypothetical protein
VVGGLINWQLRTALRRSMVVGSWLVVVGFAQAATVFLCH